MDEYEWWTGPELGDVDQRSVAGCDRVMLQNGCWSRQLTGRRAPIVAAPNDTRNRNREADDPGGDDGGSSGNGVVRAHRSPARPWSRRPQNRSPRSGTSSVVDPVIVVEKELNMMAWSTIPATCSLSRPAGMTPAADASSRRRQQLMALPLWHRLVTYRASRRTSRANGRRRPAGTPRAAPVTARRGTAWPTSCRRASAAPLPDRRAVSVPCGWP